MEDEELDGFRGGGEPPEDEAVVVGGERGRGELELPLEVRVEAVLEGGEEGGDGVRGGPRVGDAGEDLVAEAGELLLVWGGLGWGLSVSFGLGLVVGWVDGLTT